MASFTIRVELLGSPSPKVFAALHAQMQRGGFGRTLDRPVVPEQKGLSSSPHFTYYGSAYGSVSEVREWAQANVGEIWSRALILVARALPLNREET